MTSAITVVSDDAAWTERVRAALSERGVTSEPLRTLPLADAHAFPVLLLDARLEPHGGAEVGAELRWLLGDVCPPLLLAPRGREPLGDETTELFAAVLEASDDPRAVADAAARALSRMPAASGFVLRRRIERGHVGG